MKNTILIADDHPLIRKGIINELKNCVEVEIVAEACNGKEALEKILEHNPDVAIIDFEMPEMNGLKIFETVREKNIRTKFILLTMYNDKKIFWKTMDIGFHGFILKDDAIENIADAVKKVLSNEKHISPKLLPFLLEKALDENNSNTKKNEINLTPAEKKIIKLVSLLNTNEEIAETLFISKRTVENHKTNIAGKLGLQSSKQLLKYVLQNQELFD